MSYTQKIKIYANPLPPAKKSMHHLKIIMQGMDVSTGKEFENDYVI